MSKLIGADDLRIRLAAVGQAARPVGRAWSVETVRLIARYAPKRTGRGSRTVKAREGSRGDSTISSIYYLAIQDRGSRGGSIEPRNRQVLRFKVGGRTVFAARALRRAQRGLRFVERAGRDALRRPVLRDALIDVWNHAR